MRTAIYNHFDAFLGQKIDGLADAVPGRFFPAGMLPCGVRLGILGNVDLCRKS
jgi:hypothetical protein